MDSGQLPLPTDISSIPEYRVIDYQELPDSVWSFLVARQQPVAKTLYRTENLVLAALLRQLREEAGLVQTTLGQRLGRNQTYVSNVELAIRRLDLVELKDYCVGLGIELTDLIEQWETQLPRAPKKSQRPSTKRKKA